MRSPIVAALVLLALAGCCPGAIDLPDRFRPLERIENDTSDPGVFHAFGPVLKGSTCEFLGHTEKEQEALLLHEQHVAQDQLAHPGGLDGYLDHCARDRDFLASEELDGWEIQVAYSVRNGVPVDRLALAQFLSSRYYPPLDYTTALYWIDEVVTNAQGTR